MSDSQTQGYSYDPGMGRGGLSKRNIQPLTEAPTRRHRLPEPHKREGFVLGENAQSGVTKSNGGVRGGRNRSGGHY